MLFSWRGCNFSGIYSKMVVSGSILKKCTLMTRGWNSKKPHRSNLLMNLFWIFGKCQKIHSCYCGFDSSDSYDRRGVSRTPMDWQKIRVNGFCHFEDYKDHKDKLLLKISLHYTGGQFAVLVPCFFFWQFLLF